MRAIFPSYIPKGYRPSEMADYLDEKSADLPPGLRKSLLKPLRRLVSQDLLDLETWKGFWYMANYTAGYQRDLLVRRLKGEYETDEWGLDWDFMEALRPFLDFLYKIYWRVEITGVDQLPDYGPAVLVGNHSGQLPWDGIMILTALLNEHTAQRTVRVLHEDWFARLPLMATFLAKIGQVKMSLGNATALLQADEVVCVFPEGNLGLGKTFKDRYRLAHFGSSDFVKAALSANSPIYPVSVVGGEETHISLVRSSTVGQLTGLPYFPVSLRFPWLGPLGAIPLPSKWYIDIGQAIDFDKVDQDLEVEPETLSLIADKVRMNIQEMVHHRLSKRQSIYR